MRQRLVSRCGGESSERASRARVPQYVSPFCPWTYPWCIRLCIRARLPRRHVEGPPALRHHRLLKRQRLCELVDAPLHLRGVCVACIVSA